MITAERHNGMLVVRHSLPCQGWDEHRLYETGVEWSDAERAGLFEGCQLAQDEALSGVYRCVNSGVVVRLLRGGRSPPLKSFIIQRQSPGDGGRHESCGRKAEDMSQRTEHGGGGAVFGKKLPLYTTEEVEAISAVTKAEIKKAVYKHVIDPPVRGSRGRRRFSKFSGGQLAGFLAWGASKSTRRPYTHDFLRKVFSGLGTVGFAEGVKKVRDAIRRSYGEEKMVFDKLVASLASARASRRDGDEAGDALGETEQGVTE